MLDIVILFFGLMMIFIIAIGVLVATIIVGGMLIWTIYEEISMMTKAERLDGFISIIGLAVGLSSYFYFDLSGLLSFILGFLAICTFICILKFDEIKKEYKGFKHS